jgi:hypothetical protein
MFPSSAVTGCLTPKDTDPPPGPNGVTLELKLWKKTRCPAVPVKVNRGSCPVAVVVTEACGPSIVIVAAGSVTAVAVT